MRISIAGSLAICLVSVQAFKNTSPLFLASTAQTTGGENIKQLQSNDDALKLVLNFLGICPTKHYVLVSQESVNVGDYTGPRAVPFLRRVMKDERVQSTINVAEVVDQSTTDVIQEYLQKECGADVKTFEGTANSINTPYFTSETETDGAKLTRVDFQRLPSYEPTRSSLLADYDSSLGGLLQKIPYSANYTVIYTTTPATDKTHMSVYDPKFQAPFEASEKFELKRSFALSKYAEASKNVSSTAPLFEKYQFFSPGIFMGIITIFILLSILSVGINAISSLQVSYGAFEKEMGPAASKKQ